MPISASLPQWMVIVEWLTRSILILLALLSVWSFSIILERFWFFRKVRSNLSLDQLKHWVRERKFQDLTQWVQERSKQESFIHPHAFILASLMNFKESNTQANIIDRLFRSDLLELKIYLDRGLSVLATLGSNAPFIGLLGTVLGIIQAFGVLSTQSDTNAVMAGISEALIATAVGLFVAIPAVIAFNYFSRKIRVIQSECEILKELWITHRQ